MISDSANLIVPRDAVIRIQNAASNHLSNSPDSVFCEYSWKRSLIFSDIKDFLLSLDYNICFPVPID
jgi:hypothetical protein